MGSYAVRGKRWGSCSARAAPAAACSRAATAAPTATAAAAAAGPFRFNAGSRRHAVRNACARGNTACRPAGRGQSKRCHQLSQ